MVAGGATAPQVPCTKYRRLVRIATGQPLAAIVFAWLATAARMRGWGDFGRREANSKGGRSRLTVALVGAAGHGKAGAAGLRASIGLFLLGRAR